MEDNDRVLLLQLIGKLREKGSWTGETHIQKAGYFLKKMLGVPLGYDFAIHWYGPFSFDLRDELTVLRGDCCLRLNPKPYPFGPQYETTDTAAILLSRGREHVARYAGQIEFVADELKDKDVKALERLATALFVRNEMPETPLEGQIRRLIQLKPHVDGGQAAAAFQEVEQMRGRALAQFDQ